MRWPKPSTVRWGILVVLLVLWEVMPSTKIIPELFLPSLSKTLTVLWIDRVEYAEALVVTLYEVGVAMLIACGAGILTGAVVGGIATLRNVMLPVFSSLYAVPIVILYPIFTAWFGIGSESLTRRDALGDASKLSFVGRLARQGGGVVAELSAEGALTGIRYFGDGAWRSVEAVRSLVATGADAHPQRDLAQQWHAQTLTQASGCATTQTTRQQTSANKPRHFAGALLQNCR